MNNVRLPVEAMETTPAPFISVIIPTFNRLDLLKETIQSVRNQTYEDFEIVVVNDGSTDGTGAWLREQANLRVVEQSNSGIAASRNKGASVAAEHGWPSWTTTTSGRPTN